MRNKTTYFKNLSKGFTLIELIIVIAILAILAAALIALIDPGDKIKQGNDAKVLNDVNEIYSAEQRYIAQNNAVGTLGTRAAPGTLVTSGEMKAVPIPPTGYGAGYTQLTYSGAGVTDAVVCGQVQSKSQINKSTTTNTIGGTACTVASGCYFVATTSHTCYKPTVCVAGDVCP